MMSCRSCNSATPISIRGPECEDVAMLTCMLCRRPLCATHARSMVQLRHGSSKVAGGLGAALIIEKLSRPDAPGSPLMRLRGWRGTGLSWREAKHAKCVMERARSTRHQPKFEKKGRSAMLKSQKGETRASLAASREDVCEA